MAGKTGESSALIEDLLSRGHEFSFDQVMRLARIVLGSDMPELPDAAWQDRLRIRPDLSLAFPAADVSRVERTGQDGAELLVTTTFLGLYGTSSPLPTHYSEDLLDEASAESSVRRDFLDIVHQRLYQLYCQCWSKYRLFIRVAEDKDPRDRERLLCLVGLGQKELRDRLPDPWSLVRYAGLLSRSTRSTEGLQTLLRDALGVRNLEIEQCLLRQVPIPPDQLASLGISGVHLGVDAVLGKKIPEPMGKCRIHIGPLSKEDFDLLLPGTPRHERLARLVRLYITDPLEVDVRLIMAAGELRPLTLGDPNGHGLGLNTWCFSGSHPGEVSAIFPLAGAARSAPIPAGAERSVDFQNRQHEGAPASLTELYQEELARLRDLARSYAEIHPALASMVCGPVADPGVERLFEGVAFLNAHLLLKLNDDFPEVIHELAEALHPWQRRPIPAMTILAFKPGHGLTQPLLVPAGTEVASVPVEGITCRFRTCFDVTVVPLTLFEASFSAPPGMAPCYLLRCELNGMPLSAWETRSLRIFLGGGNSRARDLYLVLVRYLKRIMLISQDSGEVVEIPAHCLRPGGFGAHETILATGAPAAAGHLMLEEYFLFPDKYLFLEIDGLERCSELGGGSRLEMMFELTPCPFPVPTVQKECFIFSAVPVINLFPHQARPLTMRDGMTLQVKPAGKSPECCQVYSVDRVRAVEIGGIAGGDYPQRRSWFRANDEGPRCRVTHSASPRSDGCLTWLSLEPRMDRTRHGKQKLKIDLTCTNGSLPERLGIGDLRCATATTPESADFSNITPVTGAIHRSTGHNHHWRSLAGFSFNHLSANVGLFRAILHQSLPIDCRDQAHLKANRERIDGIRDITVVETDRLVKNRTCRGYDVRLKACGDNYTSPGDLFHFCTVLERFLRGYVTENCFMRFTVEESVQGYIFEWPDHPHKGS